MFNNCSACSPGIGNVAIRVGNFFNNLPVTNLDIDNNIIFYYKGGIDLTNINFSGDGTANNIIHNNRIFITIPHSLLTATQFGIRINKSTNIKTLYNNVDRDLNFGNYQMDAALISGIILKQANGCTVGNNTLNGVPTGIRIEASNPGLKLKCNTTNDSYYGNTLGTTTLGATVPDQGNYDAGASIFAGWDNQWNYGSLVTGVRVNVVNVVSFKWYYRYNISNPSNVFFPQASTLVVQLFSNSNGQTPCPVPSTATINREEEIGNIIRNKLTYNDHSSENDWYHKQFAFLTLKYNPGFLNQGTPDDSLYQNFYNNMLHDNIGTFAFINDTIHAGYYAVAASLNSGIKPINIIESNLKTFTAIQIDAFVNGRQFTEDEKSILSGIACQDEFIGGEAVTSAKVLLGWDEDSICEGGGGRYDVSENKSKSGQANVYPNPVRDVLTFNTSLLGTGDNLQFDLFDITGRKVLEKELYKTSSINISFLQKGVYCYKISVNGNLIESNKIVIIK